MFYGKVQTGGGAASFYQGDTDPSSLAEVARTAFADARFQGLMVEHRAAVEKAYDDHIDRVKAETGQQLVNPYRAGLINELPGVESRDPWAEFDQEIDKLAAQYPGKRDTIKPPRGVLAPVFDEMSRREEAAASAVERSPYTLRPSLPFIGEVPLNPAALAGGFAGNMTDPIQAMVNLGLGPTARVGAGAKAVLWNAAKVGAANMAVEAAQQPFIQDWRAKAGLPNGTDMAVKSVLLSGVFGFALDAGVRGASRGLGFTKGVDGLDEAARTAPDGDVLRRAADGDPEALRQVAAASGADAQPAVRGALHALEDEAGLMSPIDGMDNGDGMRSLIQALRNAEDDGEPPAGGVSPVRRADGEPIADSAVISRGQTFMKDGRPVSFAAFDPGKLAVDAQVFQFRRQVNRAGTTGRLSSVTAWDPMASGKVVVFERANGEQVIADGHHRLELAKRLSDQGPELQGYLFRERDGWTPEDVRAYAAKKNMIDSPRVDPVDAARVLRERPDLIDGSVPVGDETIRQARALAKLSDEGFGMVVGGVMPPNYAALVGDLVPDKSRHASMMAEMAEAAPANVREARYLLGDLLQLPVREEVQFTLFGVGRVERSILKERSKVLDQALRTLREDKRVFDLLNREAGRIEEAGNRLAEDANAARATEAEQVSALIESLALTRGPVSSWLSEAALSVTQGMPATTAAKAFARRVGDVLEAAGMKALIAEQPTLRANGFDEPGGPEARLQVEQLENEFATDIEEALKPELYDERQGALFALEKSQAKGRLLAAMRSAQYTHTPAAQKLTPEIKQELLRSVDMLPPDVRMRVVSKLVMPGGREADGIWDGADRMVYVALSAGDPVRTSRHEVIHALRQSALMTDAEFDTLYGFAERLGLRKAYGIDDVYAKPYGKAYGHKGDEYVENLLREETIANMFSDYSLNGRRFGDLDGGGAIDKIIDVIVRFMERLRNGLAGLGFRDVRDVFEAIETGNMARRQRLASDLFDADNTSNMRDLAEACKL